MNEQVGGENFLLSAPTLIPTNLTIAYQRKIMQDRQMNGKGKSTVAVL